MRNDENTEETKVVNLPIGIFKLNFRVMDSPGIDLPDNTLIGDFGAPISSHFPWEPCYFINGWYQKINHGMENNFTIDPEGPHTIYITKMPFYSMKSSSLPIISKGGYKLLYKEAWVENREIRAKNNKYIIQII